MSDRYNGLEKDFASFERQVEQQRLMRPADPWPKKEMTATKRKERLLAAEADFWSFDQLYFDPSMYSGGYAEPGPFQQDIARWSEEPGLQLVLGARGHAKTATAKKKFVRDILIGRITVAGTYSQTLDVSGAILQDIENLIRDNPRINSDYRIEWVIANSKNLAFRVTRELDTDHTHTVYIRAFSEGVSLRGYTRMFARPQFVLGDDIETRTSPLSNDAVTDRIRLLSEAVKSMDDGGTFLVLGNNFHEKCAANRLVKEQSQGILSDDWHVHVYPAWDDDRGPLWPQRYSASSEAELRKQIKPADEEEWQSDYQMNPIPPDGMIFERSHYQEYDGLPEDIRGVIWVDPNLSKKGKGDHTSITALGYSPTQDLYYLIRGICRSFSGSFDLLDTVLEMKISLGRMIICIGWDGHVTQESAWTDNIRNWCRQRQHPFPRVEYRRYNVDLLAKNTQGLWSDGRILMPVNFSETKDGKLYTQQLFSFQGKKANRPDDAPDGLISATELLHERGLARPKRNGPINNISITSTYSF